MAAITPIMMSPMSRMVGVWILPPASSDMLKVCTMLEGIDATIPAKMISEMPLPIPRSWICSPIHMSSMEPVVSVMTVMKVNQKPGSRIAFGLLDPSVLPPWMKAERPSPWMTASMIVP